MNYSCLSIFVAIGLSWLAYIRTDGFFSPSLVQSPHSLFRKEPSEEIGPILSQPYHYLGKGRQSFVFVSSDGRFVLKLFNQRYLQVPWYGFFLKHEKLKRERRRDFFERSYGIASEQLPEQTGLLYFGFASFLVDIEDKASRKFLVDLSQCPFVLQKKGEPFYSFLKRQYEREGIQGVAPILEAWVRQVQARMTKNIADKDHDVENNWGVLQGAPFHLDPGRLYYDPTLTQIDRRKEEWWSVSHRLQEWLEENIPEAAAYVSVSL